MYARPVTRPAAQYNRAAAVSKKIPSGTPEDAFCNGGLAFIAPAWQALKLQHVMLTQVYRQADQTFVNILNSIRMGDHNAKVCKVQRSGSIAPWPGLIVALSLARCTTQASLQVLRQQCMRELPVQVRGLARRPHPRSTTPGALDARPLCAQRGRAPCRTACGPRSSSRATRRRTR